MVITLTNGLLFGTVKGALLSWSSAMVGAILCYYISRLFGRPVVERLVGKKSLEVTDRFFQRYGRHAVLLARLIPVISFDVVSYAAGLTSIGLGDFILATGIGQAPATLAYSFLGQNMTRAARLGLWIILGVLALVTLGFALKARFEESLLSEGQQRIRYASPNVDRTGRSGVSDERFPSGGDKPSSGKAFLYEKGVPVILIILTLIAVLVLLAALAVIVGILPPR